MNPKLREFERASGLEIYGLGAKRDKWEATIERFAKLVVDDCICVVENLSPGYKDYRDQIEDAFRRDCVEQLKEHFGIDK